jgi:hypothetical protein
MAAAADAARPLADLGPEPVLSVGRERRGRGG